MIVGFVLPEWLSGALQQVIGAARGRSLQPARDHGEIGSGLDEHVYMIRHRNPGAEFVEALIAFSDLDRLRDEIRYAAVFEPQRSGALAIQDSISGSEGVSRAGVDCPLAAHWQRPPEPPGDEQIGVVWLEMRQSPTIFEHVRTGRRFACPT